MSDQDAEIPDAVWDAVTMAVPLSDILAALRAADPAYEVGELLEKAVRAALVAKAVVVRG